jgi:dephospho-CoA kinase
LKQQLAKPFFLVGVTGGIGSGKSTVCSLFSELGRAVISADKIAGQLANQDDNIKKQISKTFGEEVYLKNGLLDRKKVAKIVFQKDSLRKKLNAIVHPQVFRAIDRQVQQLSHAQRSPYVIIEAALIYEAGMDSRLDFTIVVDAGAESRIKRVIKRDGCSRKDVLDRMRSQMSVEKKLRKADFVIGNERSKTELLPKVKLIDSLLTHVAKMKTQ